MKIRQMEQRVEDVRKISTKLLDDLPKYDNFKFTLDETVNDLKHQNTELFESWCNSVMILIRSDKLRYVCFVKRLINNC